MKHIYLDHSATTPVDKKVLKEMIPYLTDKFGNAASIHSFGQTASAGVEKAREQLASFLNCKTDEVVFTSGATESDNLVIFGLIKGLQKKGIVKPHIITTLIEHSAILEPCALMQKDGAEVTYLKVKPNGVVDPELLKKSIKDNTVLISVMYANNEVGSVQPIREIGKIIKKINESRDKRWQQADTGTRANRPQQIYFHTDATQAVSYYDCDVQDLHVDLMSLSGHKIYGPKGIGALYVKTGVPIKGQQLGGHQENNLRSGTLNVPGIVGFGTAISMLTKDEIKKNSEKIAILRNQLVAGVLKKIPQTILNTDRDNSTPAHAHFSFLGVEGESVLISLDLAGIAISTGSACASGSLKPSHVLLAMGIKQEVAHNSIRFTLGKYTTRAEIGQVLKILPGVIKKLRKIRENIII